MSEETILDMVSTIKVLADEIKPVRGKRMSIDTAAALAAKLNDEDTDGWQYEARTLSTSLVESVMGVAVVIVRDEEGIELGPLGESLEPYLELEHTSFPGGWASLTVRDDGAVGILCEKGYFVETLESLPEDIQQQLKIRSKKIEELDINE